MYDEILILKCFEDTSSPSFLRTYVFITSLRVVYLLLQQIDSSISMILINDAWNDVIFEKKDVQRK